MSSCINWMMSRANLIIPPKESMLAEVARGWDDALPPYPKPFLTSRDKEVM